MLPGVGSVLAKNLVSYAGGVEEVFAMSERQLMAIPTIGKQTAAKIVSQEILEEAARELAFVQRQGIKTLFYLDDDYPWRLKHSMDSPILLYYRGTADLNAPRILGIVGTRNITTYGRKVTERLLEDLAPYKPLVISGLAYGVDIMAHRGALKHQLPTVAVVAHGLDDVYPGQHHETVRQMIEQGGGMLTEFPTQTRPNRENFPRRNRIVAGLVDALIVVESAVKGGALITAELAASYHKEVFAIPGRLDDAYSAGCNALIQRLKAQIYTSADHLAREMGWEPGTHQLAMPTVSQLPLGDDEAKIYHLIREKGQIPIDELVMALQMPVHKLSATLLELEFKGLVRSLPGSRFSIA